MTTDRTDTTASPDSGTGTTVTQKMLDDLMEQQLVETEPRYVFNRFATEDTMRHWVEGIGDPNPLFRDPEYGASTRWGGLINHPTFYFSTAMFTSPMGLPGIHGLHSGTDWEFRAPLRPGDRVQASECFYDIVEKPSRFAGRMFHQTWRTTYRRPDGEITALCYTHAMRTERDSAREKGKYADVKPHVWSEAELAVIDSAYSRELTETCRGARPRFWEEVTVGDRLEPIVRGPLTVTDVIAFKTGWGWPPFCRTGWFSWDYRQRHPKAYPVDPLLNIPDVPERVHWEERFAAAIGAPAPYDYGPQRISWAATLLTHWGGDDAWLKTFNVQLRRFNVLGDATWVRGEVTSKEIDGDEALVHVDVRCVNQDEVETLRGNGTIVLPRRET